MKKLLPFLILFLLSTNANAVIVGNLYEAEIPVPDQSTDSQQQGLQKAMQEVLVKLTGDRNVLGREVLQPLVANPVNYVQQYEFHNKSVIVDDQIATRKQLYLWASFNRDAIDRVLAQNAIPVWGTVRPSTLVWFAVTDNDKRSLIGLEDDYGYTSIMDSQARARGIKLLHPLLDQTDQQNVTIADIIGGFQEPVKTASSRYNPDAILTGSMSRQSDTQWQANWISIISGEARTWSATSDNTETLIRAGIDQLADFLAERYVQSNTSTTVSGVKILVQDITDFDALSRVLKYLQSLNSVTRVDVIDVTTSSATFEILSTGGEPAINSAIKLGRTLYSLSGRGSPYSLQQ